MKEAWLERVCLREARLFSVQMQGAMLQRAQLQGANIQDGSLTAASLERACLQGTHLLNTRMHGAQLDSAQIQGAKLWLTYMQGAILRKASLQGTGNHDWDSSIPFAQRIRKSIEKKHDDSEVVDGGLTQEGIDGLAGELLSQPKKDALKAALQPYLDKPHRRGLPVNHAAILGSYTEKEAEQWIAEHGAAMTANRQR